MVYSIQSSSLGLVSYWAGNVGGGGGTGKGHRGRSGLSSITILSGLNRRVLWIILLGVAQALLLVGIEPWQTA